MKSKLLFLPLLVFIAMFFIACDTGKPQGCVDAEGNPIVCPEPGPGCEGEACGNPNPIGPGGRKLTVQGRQIMKNGQPIVLRGMSLFWYNGDWNGGQPGNSYYTEAVVQAVADPNTWGANVIRAAIGHVYPKPGINYSSSKDAFTVAIEMMDWAYEAGIYVIVDNHSHGAHEPAQAQAAYAFFNAVSAYVRDKRNEGLDYNHVLYEVYNEPLNTDWTIIKAYAEGAINTIRANDPSGIILVGTRSWSARIDEAMLNPILIGNGNIMYVLHYYASFSGHAGYQSYLKKAYCANFPVFITEWGTPLNTGKGTIDWNKNYEWMNLVEGAGVSWANWSLSNANLPGETASALEAGVNGKTTPGGAVVKNWIRSFNAGIYTGTNITPTPPVCP
jgi:endoglucanase